MKAGYAVTTEGAIALVGATAKTVIGVKSGAAFGLDLRGYRLSFDGVTATDKAVLVEICYSTWASNAPSTNSTATTPHQKYGRVIAHGVTSAAGWSAEPTVLTVIESYLLTPIGGSIVLDERSDGTADCAVSEGFSIRCTAPTSAVNCRASLLWERC